MGEERRREAAAILTALGEHNADLKQAFFNLAELIRGIDQRKTTIAVNKVVKPAVPLAQPQFAQAVNDAVAEIETPAAAAFPDLVGLADTPTGLLWRDLGGVAAAINAATGKPLVPAVGADGQLLDFLGRLAEYDRLLTESPAARSLINPQKSRDLAERAWKLRRTLAGHIDPADDKQVPPKPGTTDPVIAALLDAHREKTRLAAAVLHDERIAFGEAELYGLNPFSLPDRLPTGLDDAELIPEFIVAADGAGWHDPNVSKAPPRNFLPALGLLREQRAAVAATLSPAVRNAVRLGLFEKPVLEWTDASWGGLRPGGGVNSGDLVVTRSRERGFTGGGMDGPIVERWVDSLYFHGRVTLTVRLVLRPKPAKLADPPAEAVVYLDRVVTPPGDLLGFARGVAVQAGDTRPRLSLDLELFKKATKPEYRLSDFDTPPVAAQLPGGKKWAKWLSEELPQTFRDQKNPFAVRFSASPARDLLSNEALVLRDDGYDAPDAADRLFPNITAEQRADLMKKLRQARGKANELEMLRATALYLDKNGTAVVRRDVALRAIIHSRTESDLAGHWARRRIDELARRDTLDRYAAARVADRLKTAGDELLARQQRRLADPNDAAGKPHREAQGIAVLLGYHLQARYPRTYEAVPAVRQRLAVLRTGDDPSAVHATWDFIGPLHPEKESGYQLRRLFVDRPAETLPALDAALARLAAHVGAFAR